MQSIDEVTLWFKSSVQQFYQVDWFSFEVWVGVFWCCFFNYCSDTFVWVYLISSPKQRLKQPFHDVQSFWGVYLLWSSKHCCLSVGAIASQMLLLLAWENANGWYCINQSLQIPYVERGESTALWCFCFFFLTDLFVALSMFREGASLAFTCDKPMQDHGRSAFSLHRQNINCAAVAQKSIC